MLLTLRWDRYSNAGAALKWREKLCGLETGFLKSPDMAGVGMPQLYGREMTTGELARSASMVICCHVRGKIFAGKSHQTRALGLMGFQPINLLLSKRLRTYRVGSPNLSCSSSGWSVNWHTAREMIRRAHILDPYEQPPL